MPQFAKVASAAKRRDAPLLIGLPVRFIRHRRRAPPSLHVQSRPAACALGADLRPGAGNARITGILHFILSPANREI